MSVKLSSLQSDQIEKLRNWRNDQELCHLLMATHSNQSHDEVRNWLETTTKDEKSKSIGNLPYQRVRRRISRTCALHVHRLGS